MLLSTRSNYENSRVCFRYAKRVYVPYMIAALREVALLHRFESSHRRERLCVWGSCAITFAYNRDKRTSVVVVAVDVVFVVYIFVNT